MKTLFIFLNAIIFSPSVFAHIHTANVKPDQIISVKTALGIATIVQTPEGIQSAIIGDQSGFKVEYLDKAVTIKPLRGSARTNLYLQTASRRYVLRLETGQQESADYVIYIKSTDSETHLIWRKVNRVATFKHLTLRCEKIADLPGDRVIVDLRLASKVDAQIKPESVWIRQAKESKAIQSLFISRLDLAPNKPVMLGLTLARADLARKPSIEILVNTENEHVALELSAELLWK